MPLIRRDEFVKAVNGPAIAGAHVYVCTQPANVTTVPPSPLATIYGDPNGITQLTQPLVTDGFGHTYFYAAAGLYTIVVVANNVVQQSYPDQLLGGAILLETNSAINVNQGILNLIPGTAITLTPDSNGGVTINSASGAVFQTNGVTNTDQSILNLVAGDGVSLSANSSGDVTISQGDTTPNFFRLCYYMAVSPAGSVNGATFYVLGAGIQSTSSTVRKGTSPTMAPNWLVQNDVQYSVVWLDTNTGSGVTIDSNPRLITRFQLTTFDTTGGAGAFYPAAFVDVGGHSWPGVGVNYLWLDNTNNIGFSYYCHQTNFQYFANGVAHDSGVVADLAEHMFEINVEFSANTISFYIDGNLVGTLTGACPPSGTVINGGAAGGTGTGIIGNGTANFYQMYQEAY